MTRRDVLHFKSVVQGRNDFLDVSIARCHKVKPTGNEMYARVDGNRRGNDLVDAGICKSSRYGHESHAGMPHCHRGLDTAHDPPQMPGKLSVDVCRRAGLNCIVGDNPLRDTT